MSDGWWFPLRDAIRKVLRARQKVLLDHFRDEVRQDWADLLKPLDL
jgi:hypothetical protein